MKAKTIPDFDQVCLAFDYETRAEVSITSGYSTPRYIELADIVILGYTIFTINGGATETGSWLRGQPFPEHVQELLSDKDVPLIAHSALFEFVASRKLAPDIDLIPSDFPLSRFYCTAMLSRIQGLPGSLDNAGRASGLPVEKDKVGREIMLKYSKPRASRKKERKFFNEFMRDPVTPAMFHPLRYGSEDCKRFLRYCEIDTEVSAELFIRACKRLADDVNFDRERRLWLLDMRMNLRGLRIDTRLLEVFSRVTDIVTAKIIKKNPGPDPDKKFLTSHTAVHKFLAHEFGIVSEKFDKESKERLLSDPNTPKKAKKLIRACYEVTRTSIAKLKAIRLRLHDDGTIRDNLVFSGAHTGRWSGHGAQPHNFPRGEYDYEDEIKPILNKIKRYSIDRAVEFICDHFKEDALKFVSSALRCLIIAPPRGKLAVGDYEQIEDRILRWLVGDQQALRDYARKIDRYARAAATVYRTTYEAIKAKGKKAKERQIGKVQTLGCGYGAGDEAFQAYAQKNGVDITLEFAGQIVDVYRAENKKIVNFWYAVEDKMVAAVKSPGRVFTLSYLQFRYDGKSLQVRLPSGRKLNYWFPKLERVTRKSKKTGRTFTKDQLLYRNSTKGWIYERTYGGKLVENIVQAIARDFMAYSMRLMDKEGFPLVLTVHDEILAELFHPDEREDDNLTLDRFTQTLNTLPKWAPNFPLSVEVWADSRYHK